MDNFWARALHKLIENLLSVKVWIIFTFLGTTTVLVWCDKISGDVFSAVNGGVIVAVVGMREAFKVAKVKADPQNEASRNLMP